MAKPTITYRGMPHSPAMDARIADLAAALDQYDHRISYFHVVVDENDRHKQKGNLFEVHVDLHIPGHEVVATRQQNEDAYVAISQAFEVVTRQLEGFRTKRRDEARHRHDGTTPPPT